MTAETSEKKPRAPRIRKKKMPSFNVLNYGFRKRVPDRWRKPRGKANKKRTRKAWAGASPRVGYRNPVSVRGLHPRGFPELLVHTPSELDGAKNVVVRVAAAVGRKKRTLIESKARSMGLDILNALREAVPSKPTDESKGER